MEQRSWRARARGESTTATRGWRWHRGRRAGAPVLGGLTCAIAAAGLGLPADAAVRDPHTVFVLKNDSIVEVEGLRNGENVLVQVRRNGVVVGSSQGPAANPGGTYMINHDFCWDGYTPEILPGDVVTVRTAAGTDTVPVTDIAVTQGPVVLGDTFTIRGTVTPRVPVGQLQVEARTNDPIRFRPLAPDVVDGVTGTIAYDTATGGDFTATFTGLSPEQVEAAGNLGEFHVAHVAATGAAGDPKEVTMATQGAPVPGPGCGLEAPAVTEAVTAVTPGLISRRNAGASLAVQGFARDAAQVTVRLRDNDPSTAAAPTRTADLSAATGAQTWRTSFGPRALAGLNGRVTVSASVDGVAATVTQAMLRDVVAPKAPTTSLPAGRYRRPQAVSINVPAGTRVRYTSGNGRQAPPTATRGKRYLGRQLRISSTTTLKMVAIDRAGNVSKVAERRFVIAR